MLGNNHFYDQLAAKGVAITPHDSNDFAKGVCSGIYVGVAGDVAAVWPDNTVTVLKSMPVGIHPIRLRRVNASLTVATDLVALY